LPVVADLRGEAAAFFAEHLRPRAPDDSVSLLGAAAGEEALDDGRRFLELMAPRGYAVPTWPREHGGLGLTGEEAPAIGQLLAEYETPDLYPFAVGLALVGPTVLVHGTDDQRARWLPAIARGEEIWCQLFSEPGAGSDLASLAARAVRDGDRWVVTGQKTWSSRAQYSRWGLLLARTDPTVPKHDGITAFAIDMQQPGIDVRPLRQMNGDAHFNEVFIDSAVVDDRDRIGDVGEGWRVARTTLLFERAGLGGAGGGGGIHRDQLIDHVRAHDAAADALVRQRLAGALTGIEVARLTAMRARDEQRSGRPPGPAGSGAKLRWSTTMKEIAELAVAVQGMAALTDAGEADWQAVFLTAPSLSIRGGTDEIQRNIVAERVLGLPRDPA
jgi:acyl-CoA dehydrogenase